jgi:signal recognition particle receptor subunit beta
MAEVGSEGTEVRARIVYWGIEGAGKSTNVQVIHSKLRPDHRGELRTMPTRLDPTVTYDTLPIELGQIGGVRTRIQIVTVPGADGQAPTRKQLLDQVDGIVFVVDTQRERIDENLASFEELRQTLASYGRALEEIPLVVQYNKRDRSDPYALEELHRKLSTRNVAAFEAVAVNGTAVLQTLTTISKRVIRHLRERSDSLAEAATATANVPAAPDPAAIQTPPPAGARQVMEVAAPPATELVAHSVPLEEESAAVDPAILYDESHPDSAAIEATAAEAEEVFDSSFRQVTAEMDAPTRVDLEADPSAEAGAFEIASMGPVTQTASGAIRIPIVLRDEAGRSVPISITVRIEADAAEHTD